MGYELKELPLSLREPVDISGILTKLVNYLAKCSPMARTRFDNTSSSALLNPIPLQP